MKISCPKCSASGTIPDHEIPETGRFLNCPRCNECFSVTKPRAAKNEYLVDTCPSCSFSTFGDETFSTCPKCGIMIKTFIERQREENILKRNQELLGKKLNNIEVSAPPPEAATTTVADFIDNLHPVKLIGWGVAAVAVAVFGFGLMGISEHDSTKIKELIFLQREEQVSDIYVFMHYALPHWVKIIYGLSSLSVAIIFLKRLKVSLKAMSGLLWTTIFLVPLIYFISFYFWVQVPIPHSFGGYLTEILYAVFISALVGLPLFLLERYLHNRKITSVVNL
jgi:predicted Zn finger-like uncharacterized protein